MLSTTITNESSKERPKSRLLKLKQSKRFSLAKNICLTLCILSFIFSIFIGLFIFTKMYPEWINLLNWLNIFYTVSILIFFALEISELNLLLNILRNILKIVFYVWIGSFVILSTLKAADKNIFAIYISCLLAYLEISIDIKEKVKETIINLKFLKSKFYLIGEKRLSTLATPITLILISLIHTTATFYSIKFLKDLNIQMIP